MHSFKVLGVLAAAFALITAAPAAAGPRAGAAGGDAGAPLYPSIVNIPMVRGEAALSRAVEYADTAQVPQAVAQLAIARAQLRKAWIGAKYVIDTAPPPPAGDGALGRISGNGGGGSPYADQYTTALGVFGLFHDVAVTSAGLTDTGGSALLSALSSSIFAALNQRDAAIAYIHSIDKPPPAGDARLAGGAIVGSWGTVMPQVIPQLDDEMQQIDGTLKGTVSSGVGRVLRAAELQDVKSERTVNQYWPPVPAG
jgi:hypothetical protein